MLFSLVRKWSYKITEQFARALQYTTCTYLLPPSSVQVYLSSLFSQGFHLSCVCLNCLFRLLNLFFTFSNVQRCKSRWWKSAYSYRNVELCWSVTRYTPDPVPLLTARMFLLPGMMQVTELRFSACVRKSICSLFKGYVSRVSRQSYNLRVDSVQWLLDKGLQPVSLYSTSNNSVLTCFLKGECRKLLEGALKCFQFFHMNVSDVCIRTLRMP